MPSSGEQDPRPTPRDEMAPLDPEMPQGDFLDSYPDRASFLRSQRDTHGWPDADDLFEPGLELGEAQLWTALTKVYDVRDQHGGIFVWRKESTTQWERAERTNERRNLASMRTERLLRSIKRWGDAFLAYLQLPDIDLSDGEIEAHFVDSYAGHYDSREALIDAQLESLGWAEALAAFKTENGIGQEDLEWNDDVLWIRCCEVYTMHEGLGGVHAFFM